MRWKINQHVLCTRCGENRMRRSEFAYRVLAPMILISGALAIPMLQMDTIPTWLPKEIAAIVVLVYLFAFCALGYYEFHDPQWSYRCRACDHTTIIPRPPYSLFEKLTFGFFLTVLVILVGLMSVLALYTLFA